MKKTLPVFLTAFAVLCTAAVSAQNIAPFWSLQGNSNANAGSKLGTTNAVPLRLHTNNVERVTIDPTGKVGIGIQNPEGKLTVFGSGSLPATSWVTSGIPVFAGYGENVAGNADHILSMASNLPNARAVFLGRRARGTLAAPAPVLANDYLLSLFGSGYDGSNFQSPATVDFFADANAFAGNVPTRISLSTGSNFGNRTERLKVLSNGNIDVNDGQMYVRQSTGYTGFGTNVPNNRVHVRQAIANRAIQWQHESLADFWTVGIGTNTLNCRFEFNGAFKAQISQADGAYSQASDRRLKEDIKPMETMRDKVMKLKPSTYFYTASRANAPHRSIGFIAQEVEELFPEVVTAADGGYKMLNYSAFGVIAIKALQEQQEQLKTVIAQTDSLKNEIAQLRELLNDLKNGSTGTSGKLSSYLEQNTPNPGNGSTIITYHLGESVGHAKLSITNANGQLIKDIMLNNRGRGQLNFNTRTLAAGVYNYTLFADGVRIDSKRLVISR